MSGTSPEFVPPPIPDHELVRRIGVGSYGEVWLARGVTGAYRAVKIVHRGSFASERPYMREFNGILKFEPVSRTHPGLVSILHVGQNQASGCFYYVMEVADDLDRGQDIRPNQYAPRTLDELLRHGPISVVDCVALGLVLTGSVQHLHQHGLAHRDIKPSNIIFIHDLPKLADIGLVTDLGRKSTFVGTEGYIPPEGPGSPGADLFGLGKVLYQMSTGLPCDQFPELPGHLPEASDPTQFALLNAVVLKACEPDPTRRFRSAQDLAEALRAVQRGVPLPPEPSAPLSARIGCRVVILFTPDDPRDARLACRIEEGLRGPVFEPVLDDRAGFGVKWARRLEAAIRDADAVVLLVSDSSLRDEIFAYQMDLALQTRRLDHDILIVPVLVALKDGLVPALDLALAPFPVVEWKPDSDDEDLANDVREVLRASFDPDHDRNAGRGDASQP
jgi:hypothetical protein